MTITENEVTTYHVGHLLAYRLRFGSGLDLSPNWGEEANGYAPGVLRVLSEQIGSDSAIYLGRSFYVRMREAVPSEVDFPSTRDRWEPLGTWLEAEADLVRLFDQDIPPMPVPNGIANHGPEIERLRVWAADDQEFIGNTVETNYVVQALQVRRPLCWPNDGCQHTNEAKAYLDLVLRYKRARLARRAVESGVDQVAVEEPPTLASLLINPREAVIADQGLRVRELEADVARLNALNVSQATSIDSLNADITRRREENTRLREQLTESREHHRADVAHVGQALLEKAEYKGWCDEFDTFVDETNTGMHVDLPVRDYEFEVTWNETYTVTVERSTTVRAHNYDDAIEAAQDEDTGEADSGDLVAAVRNGSYSFDGETDNYEASQQ